MTGYHGFVQSIIRRGWDAYQVTLGIYPENEELAGEQPGDRRSEDKLLLYRADIAIDENRTILFPDRELSKCMDAFYDSGEPADAAEGLERQKTVGRIAAAICRELSNQLLGMKTAGAV